MAKRTFSNGAEEKILNKCPICGASLIYSSLYQYSHDYKILKNGKLSKNYKKTDVGPMECGFIACTNDDCDFCTDCELDSDKYKNLYISYFDEVFKYTDDAEGLF